MLGPIQYKSGGVLPTKLLEVKKISTKELLVRKPSWEENLIAYLRIPHRLSAVTDFENLPKLPWTMLSMNHNVFVNKPQSGIWSAHESVSLSHTLHLGQHAHADIMAKLNGIMLGPLMEHRANSQINKHSDCPGNCEGLHRSH